MRKCIFILGSGRSGTSATAGCLNGLGLPIGENIIPAGENNEKGYFENKTAVDINETLLKHLKIQYNLDFLPHDEWWKEDWTEIFKFSIKDFILNEFQDEEIFIIKDPRLSLLLPLWLMSIEELKITPLFIITLRSPSEVVKSFKGDFNDDFNINIIRWFNANIFSEYYTRGYQRIFIDYNKFIQNPLDSLLKIDSQFNLNLNIDEEKQRFISEFISIKLKHQQSDHILEESVTIIPIQKLYNILSLYVNDEDYPQKLDDLREEHINRLNFFYHRKYLNSLFQYQLHLNNKPSHIATFYHKNKGGNYYKDFHIHIWKNFWMINIKEFEPGKPLDKLIFIPSNYNDEYVIEDVVLVEKNENYFRTLPKRIRSRKYKIEFNGRKIDKIYFYIKYLKLNDMLYKSPVQEIKSVFNEK